MGYRQRPNSREAGCVWSMMLSRVASSIYWLNRYIERAENYARFIEVNLNLTLDFLEGPRNNGNHW